MYLKYGMENLVQDYPLPSIQDLCHTDHNKWLTFSCQNGGGWCLAVENLMEDETHFYLNGTVNTQNYQICDYKSPNAFKEIPLYSQKVTVIVSQQKLSGQFF